MEQSSDRSEFIGLFRRSARTLNEGFIQFITVAYICLFLSFIHNVEIPDFQAAVTWIILSFPYCAVSVYFYFIYDKYFGTRKCLLMRGFSFLLVTVSMVMLMGFLSQSIIPHLACAIYAVVFMISIKKSKEDIKTANTWLSKGFIAAMLLFVCAGCLTWLRGMYPIKIGVLFFFAMKYLTSDLKHNMKSTERGGGWGTISLYWTSISMVGINIGAIPVFFAWLGLPLLSLSKPILLFTGSACLLVTTPFFIELIHKYRHIEVEREGDEL